MRLQERLLHRYVLLLLSFVQSGVFVTVINGSFVLFFIGAFVSGKIFYEFFAVAAVVLAHAHVPIGILFRPVDRVSLSTARYILLFYLVF